MRHGSLFSGIRGFELAAKWMGWENVFSCEIDDFCNKVGKFHFPDTITYNDIKQTDFTIHRGSIDVLTGGFPCQPFSNSGAQLGEYDERYLFEEMLRAVREVKPRWIVGENVRAIAAPKFSGIFEYICSSMESEGYEVQPFVIPATAVGAEHERYRLWFVAHASCNRLSGPGNVLGQMQPEKIGDRETSRFVNFIQENTMPFVCSSHYGLPRKLAESALHGAGNAIVPQVALQIYKAIEQYETIHRDRI